MKLKTQVTCLLHNSRRQFNLNFDIPWIPFLQTALNDGFRFLLFIAVFLCEPDGTIYLCSKGMQVDRHAMREKWSIESTLPEQMSLFQHTLCLFIRFSLGLIFE